VVGGPAGLTGAGVVVAAVAELALDEVPAAAAAVAVEPLVGVDVVLVEVAVAAAATVWANSRCARDDWVEGCRAACGLATARSAASIELIEET
jgi:protein gp37